jgi:hypothetical protein
MKLATAGRYVVLSLTLAMAACVTAPPPERASILELMEQGATPRPQDCAALNAATFCEQVSRLDRTKKCSCVDRRSLTNGTPYVF